MSLFSLILIDIQDKILNSGINWNQATILIQITNYSFLQNNLLIVDQPSFHSKISANVMAQPAVPVNEDRTDLLGIPSFWAKASINPPFLWESWIGQFFLAAGLKDNMNFTIF